MALTHIPENIRRCMPKENRTDNLTMTNAEVSAKVEAQSEKDLQLQIAQYLRLRGVKEPGMNKFRVKSSMPPGWPDFYFRFNGVSIALEVKVGYNKQSEEQKDMECNLKADGVTYMVVRSLPEVKLLLDAV